MPINTIEHAKKFTGELDKLYAQKSATGFFADNVLRTKFVGAKTVIIPDMDFVGLVDYDRDNGFNRAALTVAQTPFTMAMDRGRSIQIDREDLDETGVANLAGQVMGEYVRTKVVPETDAYVISKLAGIANDNNQTAAWDGTNPYSVFTNLVGEVQDKAGYDEELVCFVDKTALAALENSKEFSRMITVSDFKQGEVNLKVKHINGVAIIPVSSDRMKTAYNFATNESDKSAGGFTPDGSAKAIHMLVLPKKAASLVKKTETIRIFTPEQNLDADAYKFDYRVYYDVFVKKSGINSVWASFGA
jgi:hypothetical protein